MPEPADARNAVHLGMAYLSAQQTSGGWWVDFPPLVSDEYVTAFVCARIRDLPGASTACSRAQHALVQRLRMREALSAADVGWGWATDYPADCDTTGLGFSQCLPHLTSAERAGIRKTLRTGRRGDGEAAYSDVKALARATGLPETADFGGWTRAVNCVTVVAVEHDPSLVPVLAARQSREGHWASYYWADPAYVTALATAALEPNFPGSMTLAAEWAVRSTSLTNFGLAWRLAIVSRACGPAGGEPRWASHRDRLAVDLLSRQRPEGSWSPGAVIGMPSPAVTDPDYGVEWEPDAQGLNRTLVDERAIVTTASAIAALAALDSPHA